MNQQFLMSLPDDPIEAFLVFEEKMRETHSYHDDNYGSDVLDKKAYIADIIGFTQSHNLDFGIGNEIPFDENGFYNFYTTAYTKIRIFCAKAYTDAAKKAKSNISPEYVMTSSIRKEIHRYLFLIREVLDKAEFSEEKKNVLHKRLDAFSAEVNQDKTRLQAWGSSCVYIMKMIGEGAKELEPVAELIQNVHKALGRAEETTPSLPKPEEKKQIEAPLKKLEHVDSNAV